jgi:hypothetical protein
MMGMAGLEYNVNNGKHAHQKQNSKFYEWHHHCVIFYHLRQLQHGESCCQYHLSTLFTRLYYMH